LRSLPNDKTQNPTSAVVYWFYTTFFGRKPDSTMYARHMNRKNPRALVHMVSPDSDEMQAYSASEIGELVWYLVDNGVAISDLGVVAIPGLAYNFTNRKINEACAAELERTVLWLKGLSGKSNSTGQAEMYSKFNGWGG
jgi:hypothetical protein